MFVINLEVYWNYCPARICNSVLGERLYFNPVFSPFYIGDGQIANSMAVYHSTIFCY